MNEKSVPDSLMIPIGQKWTKKLETCADSWSDSQIMVMRAELPQRYHAVPCDELRRLWINIRKRGTDGYRVNGKGPSVGSRIKKTRKPTPAWYLEYLKSTWFATVRERALRFWGYRCAVCYTHQDERTIDIHHRTYERCPGAETETDVIALCRHCHELYETQIPDKLSGRTLFSSMSTMTRSL